jgi:polysaccharide pyruvyl transferase WcaK-like protein
MRIVEKLSHHSRGLRAVTDDLAWLAAKPIASERRHAIAISARPWKDATPKVIAAFHFFCEHAQAEGWQILPASFDRTMDDAVLDEIAPISPRDLRLDCPQALAEGMASVEATVAMRLHAGIFSVAAGTAPTLVSYDDKVMTFGRSIGQNPLPVASLTGEDLWEAFKLTESNRSALDSQAGVRRELGLRRSRLNIEMLESFLQGGRT